MDATPEIGIEMVEPIVIDDVEPHIVKVEGEENDSTDDNESDDDGSNTVSYTHLDVYKRQEYQAH